jgi:hypothetical protein
MQAGVSASEHTSVSEWVERSVLTDQVRAERLGGQGGSRGKWLNEEKSDGEGGEWKGGMKR